MNILVTGGSGRIGGFVLRELLHAGYSASSYSRRAPLVEGVRFIQGDVTNLDQLREACPGHDAIIHLAAVAAPGLSSPERLMVVNVMGTVHVLEAALQAGIGKMVFASSGAAVGISFAKHELVPHYLPIDEEHPCEPQDEYGLSKLLGELTCRRYSDAVGMHTICLRMGNNWYVDREGAEVVIRSGSGTVRFRSVEELWTEYQQRRQNPEAGWPPGPKVLWDAVDARDTAVACRLAVENDEVVHGVFFIYGDKTYPIIETPELIARFYPNVPLKSPLAGHASLVSHDKATRLLGYQTRYGWRESNFKAWLEASGDPF